jgi:Fe-S oxidoreductase
VRALLQGLPGIAWAEADKEHPMEARGRRAQCCGGGGGQAWLHRPGGQRIEEMRAADVVATGAQVCVTACPYCAAMLSNGLAAIGSDVPVRDWIEVVAECLA